MWRRSKNAKSFSYMVQPKSPIYELWLKDTFHIKSDIDDKLRTLPRFLKFFWNMKCRLAESILDFAQLKKEQAEHIEKNGLVDVTPSNSLSTIVNPSILKLLEKDDKAGMRLLGPFYCGPSSP
ncbi:hypothetical protein G6F56_002193 [Rhizopus delemar]|nr:hypothetical protein G6F56_002193 [Rhizopus delemar]